MAKVKCACKHKVAFNKKIEDLTRMLKKAKTVNEKERLKKVIKAFKDSKSIL